MDRALYPRSRFVLAAVLAAGLALPPALGRAEEAAAASPAAVSDTAYRQEVESWRQDRLKSLKNENGWLTLVGLFWLDEGENRFGSDAANKVTLPAGKAPKVAGTLVRKGEAVTVKVAPGAQVTQEGKPVTEMALASDAGGKPTVLEMGPVSFFVIRRGDRVGVRVKDKASPVLASFHGIDSYPVDPSWRVTARFEPYRPVKKVPVPNVLGTMEDTPSPGALVFERDGKTYRLDAFGDSAEGELFLIFADPTNGKETYGAGRFLDTEAPKDGKVVVDFNKAYNPPCALTVWRCASKRGRRRSPAGITERDRSLRLRRERGGERLVPLQGFCGTLVF
jgi:uncharacterized protein (DUF1684 family)